MVDFRGAGQIMQLYVHELLKGSIGIDEIIDSIFSDKKILVKKWLAKIQRMIYFWQKNQIVNFQHKIDFYHSVKALC